MGFKRKASRVEAGRAGRLQRGTLSASCKVLDVSETGVRIEAACSCNAAMRFNL